MNKSSSKFGISAPRSLNTSMGLYTKKKSREAFSPKDENSSSIARSVSKVSVSHQKQVLAD